jgi:hypothetical protein
LAATRAATTGVVGGGCPELTRTAERVILALRPLVVVELVSTRYMKGKGSLQAGRTLSGGVEERTTDSTGTGLVRCRSRSNQVRPYGKEASGMRGVRRRWKSMGW